MKNKNNDNLVIKKERRFKISLSFASFCKIVLYSAIIFIIWYLVNFKHIIIYFVEPRSKNEGYFYSILNSMMLMIFLVSCGFTINLSSRKIKIIIVLIILMLILEGYTDVGLGIRFRSNFDLLIIDSYESNSSVGIEFFIYNFLVLWIYVYIISLFFETEKE